MVTTRSTTIDKHGRIWIKQNIYKPLLKVEITKNDSSVVDMTSWVKSCSATNGVTTSVGSFKVEIVNTDGQFTGDFDGGENVDISMGYANAMGLVVQMSGEVDVVEYSIDKSGGLMLSLSGNAYGSELLDTTINKVYTNREASDIIKNASDGILAGTNITSANVQTTTITFTGISFSQTSRWDCIRDICEKIGYDAYVDGNKDLHFYPAGTVESAKESAVIGDNILGLRTQTDRKKVRNKMWVYGSSYDNDVQFIGFNQDAESQALYRVKELVINESSIDTMRELKDKVNYGLEDYKTLVQEGSVDCIGMPQLNPGDSIRISCALCNCNGLFIIKEYTHSFSKNGFVTSITFGRQKYGLDKIFKDTKIKSDSIQTITNPNQMTASFILLFKDDTDIDVLYRTVITSDGVKLSGGFSAGTVQSVVENAVSNVSYYELKVNESEDCILTSYDISLDGGNTWDTNVSRFALLSPVNTSGKQIVIRININASSIYPNPKIANVALLYK